MAPFASRKAAKCTAKGIILERKKCPLRKALNANHLQGDNTVSIDTLSPSHEGDARRTSTCMANCSCVKSFSYLYFYHKHFSFIRYSR